MIIREEIEDKLCSLVSLDFLWTGVSLILSQLSGFIMNFFVT